MSLSVAAVSESEVGLPRLPPWIRTRPPAGAGYVAVKDTLTGLGLGTVCREARCPNLSECWSAGAATIMLLGTSCSRRCGFCAVSTHWSHGEVDATEPARVAQAVHRWGLRYVVLTQVCRDDLADGGATVLAATVRSIRDVAPSTLIELLIGDLGGDERSLGMVLDARPDVLAHNLETVRRLSSAVRDHRAGYDRSLRVLEVAKEAGPSRLVTKSSLMLGLGERPEEIDDAFVDLRARGVDLLTLGQYLRPGPRFLPVDRFVPPEEFARLGQRARGRGFAAVESGPLVRSSYRAESLYRTAVARRGT